MVGRGEGENFLASDIPAFLQHTKQMVVIDDDRVVTVEMTLTAPGCPVAGEMPKWVQDAVNAVPGVMETKVKLTFDPPWNQSRMSDEAKLAVGMF